MSQLLAHLSSVMQQRSFGDWVRHHPRLTTLPPRFYRFCRDARLFVVSHRQRLERDKPLQTELPQPHLREPWKTRTWLASASSLTNVFRLTSRRCSFLSCLSYPSQNFEGACYVVRRPRFRQRHTGLHSLRLSEEIFADAVQEALQLCRGRGRHGTGTWGRYRLRRCWAIQGG